jgi:7,8-dihydropterin-6-yl-methyl-4-(beta-D-ribofuranosyl)aminobenzene 5'-phosphate synthase
MKVTVVVDNKGSQTIPDLAGEHGLCLLIETDSNKLLFDTGASDLFARNAKMLGIDLETIDALVLSHGHYDHGGGLAAFLSINKHAKVYMGPGALDTHIAKLFGILSKDIGLNRKALEPFRDRLVSVDKMTEIAKGAFVLPQIEMLSRTPKDMGMFYRKTSAGLLKEDFSHEVLLVIQDTKGISVVTGCAHKGILNIVSASEAQFPQVAIKAIIGGLHMTNPVTKRLSESKEVIRSIGTTLRNDTRISKLYTGHCTGEAAFLLLKDAMGEKLEPIMVGKQIVV